jgi:tripartite-type tricarboxylate transporter receptor subunit TctC
MRAFLNRRRVLVAACGAALVASPFAVQADTWPSKPVKIVVSFAPGGTTDILARYLADKLTTHLGQVFIVDNRPGAGGLVGNDYVAKSTPDGYTLLMGSASSLAVNVGMYSHIPYDPKKDFEPVMQVAAGPFVIVVNPKVPANNLAELLALAKQKPGELHFASSGNGTSLHLAGELLNAMAGTKITHVPYKGTGPATMDTISGVVEMTISDMVPFVPHIKAGRLRAIAQTTLHRSRLLPDLPAVSETVPGYDATSWYGMMVPAGTPRPIIERLHAELTKILDQPDVKAKYAELGVEPVKNTPEQFGRFIVAEQVKWAEVVKKSGAKVD